MTRVALALRIGGFALIVLWMAPTILLALASLAWRHFAFDLRMARVRRLRRAGRLDEARAALERINLDRD